MNRLQKPVLTASLFACLFLFGCGGKPYTPVPADDLKSGPGLFSGKDGVIILLSTKEEEKEQRTEEDAAAEP